MKATIKALLILSLFSFTFTSCKEDEDEEGELSINFETGAGFVYSDTTLAGGSNVEFGIEAETEKPNDPLLSFNISESVNGGAATSIFQEDTINAAVFITDYGFTLDTTSGDTHKYTFTVTNKDGINEQEELTITIQ